MIDGRPAVFLDRDGTINEEVDFVKTPDQLVLIPGAARAIRSLNEAGYVTCVISNQSGIARGLYSEEDLVLIHERLTRELLQEQAYVDRIYYCPHHPTQGIPQYQVACSCRKPKPGMLLRGEEELSIDFTRSFVVGDRIVDVQVGKAVGARTILVMTGYGRNSLEECRQERVFPDYVASALPEAVEYIVGDHSGNA